MENMKVKFGCSDYKIKLHDDKIIENNEELLGYCDNLNKIIGISAETPKPSLKQVFFHEIVHAILDEIGQFDLNDNEVFVEAFSKQLCTFLSNNTIEDFYKFINAE